MFDPTPWGRLSDPISEPGVFLSRVNKLVHYIEASPDYTERLAELRMVMTSLDEAVIQETLVQELFAGVGAFPSELHRHCFGWIVLTYINSQAMELGSRLELVAILERVGLARRSSLQEYPWSRTPNSVCGCMIVAKEYILPLRSYLAKPMTQAPTRTDDVASSREKMGRGVARRHAKNRECLLGGALAVLVAHWDECKSTRGPNPGAVTAAAIYRAITEYSLQLYGGDPPLGEEAGRAAILDWLNKLRQPCEGGK